MNRCTISLRRAKQAAYYKAPKYVHPSKQSHIPIAQHPKFGNWENRDSMDHLEYMKQKVLCQKNEIDRTLEIQQAKTEFENQAQKWAH